MCECPNGLFSGFHGLIWPTSSDPAQTPPLPCHPVHVRTGQGPLHALADGANVDGWFHMCPKDKSWLCESISSGGGGGPKSGLFWSRVGGNNLCRGPLLTLPQSPSPLPVFPGISLTIRPSSLWENGPPSSYCPRNRPREIALSLVHEQQQTWRLIKLPFLFLQDFFH